MQEGVIVPIYGIHCSHKETENLLIYPKYLVYISAPLRVHA